jgi:hypothetical protein
MSSIFRGRERVLGGGPGGIPIAFVKMGFL